MACNIPMPHPGTILKEDFLEPLDMSVYSLAKEIRVHRSQINGIFLGKRGITANIALRLGKFFDVDPEWFLNMQAKYDLHVQRSKLAKELAAITPRAVA